MARIESVSLGSTGFAQVGRDDYHDKQKIEGAVLLQQIRKKHPIPEEFQDICEYKWASHPHDFGRYHELELIYLEDAVERWADRNENKFDRFWDFANEVEGFDFDDEQIEMMISDLYIEFLKVKQAKQREKWKTEKEVN